MIKASDFLHVLHGKKIFSSVIAFGFCFILILIVFKYTLENRPGGVFFEFLGQND